VASKTLEGRESASRVKDFDKTTFVRPSKGRNLLGMLSHVFRPMTTALVLIGTITPLTLLLMPVLLAPVPMVKSLKCFMSPGNFQGKSPFQPMPRVDADAATTAVAAMSLVIIIAYVVLLRWTEEG
jgi:hypothetical protein